MYGAAGLTAAVCDTLPRLFAKMNGMVPNHPNGRNPAAPSPRGRRVFLIFSDKSLFPAVRLW